MTLEELLNTISFHYEGCTNENCENLNNQLLKFNIQIEHNVNEIHFINKTKTTQANLVDIDNNEQTITLKYKYKG